MGSRRASPTQRYLKCCGTPRRKLAQSEPRVPRPVPCRQGPTWTGELVTGLLTHGEGLPQGGAPAAHKALGGTATWGRSWRGSAKQRHPSLRDGEGESPRTGFQGPGSRDKGPCTLNTGKTLFRGPQRPKRQSDHLSSSAMQKEAPGTQVQKCLPAPEGSSSESDRWLQRSGDMGTQPYLSSRALNTPTCLTAIILTPALPPLPPALPATAWSLPGKGTANSSEHVTYLWSLLVDLQLLHCERQPQW